MAKLLLNADGKVLMGNDKVLTVPESTNPFQTFVTGKGSNAGYDLFKNYKGENVDFISDIDFSTNETCNSMFYDCTNLQTIPQLNTSNVTDMYGMFMNCSSLQTIPELDTSKVTTMKNMFYYCSSLQTIPQLNTSKVTDMSGMFYYCENLQTIPQLDTGNVINMNLMFQNCTKLQTIPQLDTSKVTSMSSMFNGCKNLQIIDFPSLDKVSSASYIGNIFYGCCSLTKIIIRTMTKLPPLGATAFDKCYHFKGTVDATYNPEGLKDGRIYVPDNYVDPLKVATNWSVYADCIVPLSTLQEE